MDSPVVAEVLVVVELPEVGKVTPSFMLVKITFNTENTLWTPKQNNQLEIHYPKT